jgi:hypothetical protein
MPFMSLNGLHHLPKTRDFAYPQALGRCGHWGWF